MFSIKKYEHKFLNEEKQYFRVDFFYTGDDTKKIKIKLYENATNARWQVVGGIINVKKNVNYWVEDTFPYKFESFYNNDIILKIIDVDTDKIIFEKLLRTSSINIKKRSLGGDFSKKNTWIIGDSHTNHFFSYDINYDIKNFETNSTIINPAAFPLLSINRFVNIDYLKILNNLPIFDGDDICLFIGEIDTRVGILRNSDLKNISYVEQIYNLTKRFVDVIKVIKNKYPNCNIYYILPNPPVKDGWLSEDKIEVGFGNTTEKDRFNIRYGFENIIIKEMKKIDVDVLKIYKNYLKPDMFVDEKFLIYGDHHFKTPNNFLGLIKEYFK